MSDEAPKPAKPATGSDVLLLHSPTEDGEGVRVLRAREDRLEAGEVRPLKDGRPLATGGEIVKLAPRAQAPQVCDVEVLSKVEPGWTAGADRSGPAQVATTAYRESWDRIFGEPKTLN
jgi:hypothetical protein